MTPCVPLRPRKGRAMTERTVCGWAPLACLTRGSSWASGTSSVSPCSTTQPATPSPTFTRRSRRRSLFSARGNRVVELLARFVQHQQRPQVGLDESLHVLHDGAQNRIQVEARGQRTRHLVEDKKVFERDAVFRLFGHGRSPLLHIRCPAERNSKSCGRTDSDCWLGTEVRASVLTIEPTKCT
jgi:hypothetical protein